MAIRQIIYKGDEVLNKKCKDVVSFDEKLHVLLDDMIDTMHKANGVGLAAPQIGILRKVAVVLDIDTDKIYELVNPEIISTEGEISDVEGCLSLPGIYGYVTRPETMKVKAYDRNGKQYQVEIKGFLARAFSHEIDHLFGNLFDEKVTEYLDSNEVE